MKVQALKTKQAGVALIIGLIFLLLMSIMGLAAMQNVTLQERIGGNSIDNYRAFQSAEVALASAEQATESVNFDNDFVREVLPPASILMTDIELLDPVNWDQCDDSNLKGTGDVNERKLCIQSTDHQDPNATRIPMIKYEKIGSKEFVITVRARGEGRSMVVLQSVYIIN